MKKPETSYKARAVSKDIVKMLFTDGDGRRADRLALMHGSPVEQEKMGGGLCEKAVLDRVAVILTKFGIK